MNVKLERLQAFLADLDPFAGPSGLLRQRAAAAAVDLTELVDTFEARQFALEALLGRIYLRITQTLAEPARMDSAVLVELVTMIEAVAVGGAPATATAIVLTPGASVVEQVDVLLRQQEWTRIPGVGFRCPVCVASRSRGHRAACWLRQARLLLSVGGGSHGDETRALAGKPGD